MADAYRPRAPGNPLNPANRYLRLHAAFQPPGRDIPKPPGYVGTLWVGIFDAAYTKRGDYLLREGETWFIAAQQPLLPVLCVKTNRTVSVYRAAHRFAVGLAEYGGGTERSSEALLNQWPANVLSTSASGRPTADLPSDSGIDTWTVLLPDALDLTFWSSDVITDDLGRHGIVTSAELNDLGWRLTVKQAAT
jgi:hypothetical protein